MLFYIRNVYNNMIKSALYQVQLVNSSITLLGSFIRAPAYLTFDGNQYKAAQTIVSTAGG